MTKEELAQFKKLLLEHRRVLAGDVNHLENNALRNPKENAATLDISNFADLGSDNFEQDFAIGLLENSEATVREIDAALQRIEDGTYGVCEESGEPIGKSRLKTDLAARIDELTERRAYYLEGAGQPLTEEQPFAALGDLIRRWAGLGVNCAEADAALRLTALLKQHGGASDPVEAGRLLATVVSGEHPDEQVATWAQEPPQVRRKRITEAIVELLLALGARRPAVLCIDDAHHADQASIEILGRLLAAGAGRALLVMLVGRPEVVARTADLAERVTGTVPPTSSVTLEPLSPCSGAGTFVDLGAPLPPGFPGWSDGPNIGAF